MYACLISYLKRHVRNSVNNPAVLYTSHCKQGVDILRRRKQAADLSALIVAAHQLQLHDLCKSAALAHNVGSIRYTKLIFIIVNFSDPVDCLRSSAVLLFSSLTYTSTCIYCFRSILSSLCLFICVATRAVKL